MTEESDVIQESRAEGRIQYLVQRRKKLYKMLIAPVAIDMLMSFGALPFLAAGSTVIEEVIEFFISKFFAERAEDLELSNTDKLFGLLPIPGVTAFNVRCAREIYEINQELKNFL